jgi:hypothetical protein
MCRCEKNKVLPLRQVCKAFDTALKPYVLKTIQLEFSKFAKSANMPFLQDVDRIGQYCQAVYLDMMVVRDEGTSVPPVVFCMSPYVPEEIFLRILNNMFYRRNYAPIRGL